MFIKFTEFIEFNLVAPKALWSFIEALHLNFFKERYCSKLELSKLVDFKQLRLLKKIQSTVLGNHKIK